MDHIFIGDCETNSLTPDKFWCIVLKEFKHNKYFTFVNDDHLAEVIDEFPDAMPLSSFKTWFEELTSNKFIRLVFHNGIDFDFHWLEKHFGVSIFDNEHISFRDTYVLSRLADPIRKGGHSVEAWGEEFDIMKTEIADDQWSSFDPLMVERCIVDVRIQEKIYDHLREKELRGFSLSSIEIEHDTQRLISLQRRNGVYIHPQKLQELFVETQRHFKYLEREITKNFKPKPKFIREYIPKETKDGRWAKRSFGPDLDASTVVGPFSSIHYVPFNINSAPQRIERLLDLGWKPTEFTPAGNPKFTEDSLANLPEDAPKELRQIGEYLMSYSRNGLCKQIMDLVDRNDYLHGYVNTIGAATHRMSSNSPNLQNIPRASKERGVKGTWGYECRDMFTIENPLVNCLVDCDASGIQLRGLAHYGNDNEYISLVSDPNVDIHKVHADVLECSRSVAKTFIYAFLMGAGAKKLIWVLGGNDINKGAALLEAFYKRFPFLKEFKRRLDAEVQRGYHIALDGRLIRLDEEKPHKAMAVALQSFEAIVMKKALKIYHDALVNEKIWFIQRLMVHDEFLVETRKNTATKVGQTMAAAIKEAGVVLDSKCPLAGEFHIGETWAVVH